MIRSPLLGDVPHGFSTREGLSAGDILPGAALVQLRQVHSPIVVVVDAPPAGGPLPRGDALVTARPGLLLAIETADCAPVLIADAEAGVVGAAHAGWRGAHGDVIAGTVAAMERLGARAGKSVAAIGPCIAQPNYEVDAPFRANFTAAEERFFAPGRTDHWHFDLPAYVAARLADAGIARVELSGHDTYGEEASFYSYRRATHRGEPTGGRQCSVIGLNMRP